MNYGPLVFLGVFFTLALSWLGLVFGPQVQLGTAQPTTNMVNTVELFPQRPPGMAGQGAELYRSLGCASCHTRQVSQTGRIYHIALTDAGTNRMALVDVLRGLMPEAGSDDLNRLIESVPQTFLRNVSLPKAEAAIESLKSAGGAQGEIRVIPTGPDIDRNWGKRRSVAEDYLFDEPVLLGSQRIGPDLAHLGARLPDGDWHLQHLFNPRLVVPKSVMPPYPFLFEKRRIGQAPSTDALKLTGDQAPEPGYEIVPTDAAHQLVAYLISQRLETPIFPAPITPPPSAAPPAATNAPAPVVTNTITQ